MLLISRKEKKAKRVIFDGRRTVILGKNNTGKSSLIKSIYWALGAEPSLHPNFKGAQVSVLLKFIVDDIKYEILREGKRISLFDGFTNEIIKTFSSITKELAPYLAEIFAFKPVFQTKDNQFVIPHQLFYFYHIMLIRMRVGKRAGTHLINYSI
ncbi:hypothetical protein [Spirosoma telluris]